jgi:N-acetylneuraminic acid mutarotase
LGGSAGASGGRYNPSTNTWSSIAAANAPTQYERHTAVWTGSEMIIWGGADTRITDRGARYDPENDTWQPTSRVGAPVARYYHASVWTGSLMIVWGGLTGEFANSGGRYDPSSDTWTPTSMGPGPSPGAGMLRSGRAAKC